MSHHCFMRFLRVGLSMSVTHVLDTLGRHIVASQRHCAEKLEIIFQSFALGIWFTNVSLLFNETSLALHVFIDDITYTAMAFRTVDTVYRIYKLHSWTFLHHESSFQMFPRILIRSLSRYIYLPITVDRIYLLSLFLLRAPPRRTFFSFVCLNCTISLATPTIFLTLDLRFIRNRFTPSLLRSKIIFSCHGNLEYVFLERSVRNLHCLRHVAYICSVR